MLLIRHRLRRRRHLLAVIRLGASRRGRRGETRLHVEMTVVDVVVVDVDVVVNIAVHVHVVVNIVVHVDVVGVDVVVNVVIVNVVGVDVVASRRRLRKTHASVKNNGPEFVFRR